MSEIERLKEEVAQGRNPRDVKFLLGEEIVTRFHSEAAARKARENFIARFQKGAMPDEMPEVTLTAGADGLPIANLLREAGLVPSTSEALRMIRQGAVRIDGEKISDTKRVLPAGEAHVFQVGKRRFARVKLM